ncbi:hypothetical protein NM688_g3020 [Phlebia brevispora]|uniref:Uncharacterized protein n=1 Tax=Phlebia brevispora TaxID=194682 RepID=A0ACC1T705_9APHY|nr:hypothetical protein NM688_g3020 [Phlebia brevispora]
MAVTFHALKKTSELPSQVDRVVKLFQTPLPSTEEIAALPCLTPIAAKHLQKIPDRPHVEGVIHDKLLGVANLVLMQSAGIEELVNLHDGYGPRHTRPLWQTLLGTIARYSHKDAEVIRDIPFIYPKGFRREQDVASMLVTFAAEESLIESNLKPEDDEHSNNRTSTGLSDAVQQLKLTSSCDSPPESGVESEGEDEDEDEGEGEGEGEGDSTEESSYDELKDHPIFTADPTTWRPKYDEGELFFGLDRVDEHEPPEEKLLDLPLDAHILAERRAWHDVLFPVLCVAEGAKIIPLVSSAVYQRATWDIDLPVVGFEMSKFGSTVGVFVGWFDTSSNADHKPMVHILFPDEDVSELSKDSLSRAGYFDLSQPQSALELGQFMASLGYQFEALREELPSRRLRNLHWRCDDDASKLPSNVDNVMQLLQRPLPNTQKIASLPCITPIAAKQLQRIPVRPLDESLMNEKLLDVANLVLMASAGIEELVKRGDGCGSRPTKSLWYTLLRSIARCCHQDAEVSGDVPFIYPQGFEGEQGVASMLVTFSAGESLIASNLKAEDSVFPCDTTSMHLPGAVQCINLTANCDSPPESGVEDETCTNDSEDDGAEDDYQSMDSSYDELDDHPIFTAEPDFWEPEYDEAELFFGLDHVDEHEPSEAAWLDLPLCAHILASRRAWPVVTFPILSVAKAEEIVPLLSTVLYQRATWGIDIPAIGFEISDFSSIVRVHVGWLGSSSGVDQLPSIHILRPDEEVSKRLPDSLSCAGLFDLSNPQSALELAQFVISLDYQFDALRDELPSRRLSRLGWRSDDVDATWAEDVEGWRTFVDKSDGSSTADSSYPHTPPPGHKFNIDMPPKRGSKRERPSKSAPATVQGATATPQNKQGSTQTQGSSTKQFSASEFAKVNDTNITQRSSIVTWMLHRWTFTIAKYRLPKTPHSFPPEYERMVEAYDNLSRFEWVENWEMAENMPPVDSCLAKYRDVMFTAYTVWKGSPSYEPRFMDTKHANVVNSRLSLLFKSVDGAYTREARPFANFEAESRHDWDALMFNFYIDGSANATSADVFLERELRLPRNTLSDQLALSSRKEYINGLQDCLEEWSNQNSAVRSHVRRHEDGENQLFREQCKQAYLASVDLGTRFEGLASSSRIRAVVQAQAKTEPASAKCDAILVTSIPVNLERGVETKVLEAYKNFRLAKIDDDKGSVESKVPSSASEEQTTSDAIENVTGAGRNENAGRDTEDAGSGTEDTDEDAHHVGGNPKDAVEDAQSSRKRIKSLALYYFPLGVVGNDPMHKVLLKGTTSVNPGTATPHAADTPANDLVTEALPSIFLPQLVVEYKKQDQPEGKALNQARMYSVASISYLAAIGIKAYPVFTLAAHGTLGNLIMTWMSENGAIYMMERNIRKFDISNPLSAFHFASILLRLRARDRELSALFREHEKGLLEKLSNGDWEKWAMEDRVNRQSQASTSSGTPVVASGQKTPLAVLPEDDEHGLAEQVGSMRIN